MSKRLEDIKNEYSKEHNYADWEEMINDAAHWMVEKHMDDICIRYAREVAQASLEIANENSELLVKIEGNKLAGNVQKTAYIPERGYMISVYKESITNPDNIALL